VTKPSLAIVVAAVAVLIGAQASPSARPQGSCVAGFVPAHINGHFQCLHEGQSCKRKLDRAYQRYHFRCLGRYLTFDWSFLRRPFHLPEPTPGSPCPTSEQTGSLDRFEPGLTLPAWGPGPAYPTGLGTGPTPALGYFFPVEPTVYGTTDWGETKALWIIAPPNRGQMLIRGRQLDGPNELRFEDGVPGFTAFKALHPVTELHIRSDGDHPAVTRVRAPGCYAYQVDGLRFSYDTVFEARSLGPEPRA
jgi:hypothetical protein